MLQRLENEKREVDKPMPFKEPDEKSTWKYVPPVEPVSKRQVVYDSAIE